MLPHTHTPPPMKRMHPTVHVEGCSGSLRVQPSKASRSLRLHASTRPAAESSRPARPSHRHHITSQHNTHAHQSCTRRSPHLAHLTHLPACFPPTLHPLPPRLPTPARHPRTPPCTPMHPIHCPTHKAHTAHHSPYSTTPLLRTVSGLSSHGPWLLRSHSREPPTAPSQWSRGCPPQRPAAASTRPDPPKHTTHDAHHITYTHTTTATAPTTHKASLC
jgi:hypothetical protein